MLVRLDGWKCSECGYSQEDLHRESNCPHCDAALQTDSSKMLKILLHHNQRFLRSVSEAMNQKQEIMFRLNVKVSRGGVTAVKITSDEDCGLDNGR